MKKFALFSIVATMAVSFSASGSGPGTPGLAKNTISGFRLPAGVTASDIVPGKLIIKLDPAFRSNARTNGVQHAALTSALQAIGASSISKKFPAKAAPASSTNRNGQRMADLSLIYEVAYSSTLPLEKIINQLMNTGILAYAEPKYLPKLHYTPNDPNMGLQYFLGKIQAYDAWDISKGDTSVVIGITDTGTDTNHPDLAGNMKRNYADPINGIDDDGDGYTDNFTGWDLGENDNDPAVNASTHGSHVAGCAAAVTDNGTGVASPGFYSKYLPVKISDANGDLTEAYEGIVYAADHGCAIINCSWGGPGGGSFGQDIIDYATTNMNALVIASAGNDGTETENFPAAYEYVLSVGSTTNSDSKSNFSNYGSFIDVCAPGSNIYSTISNNNYTYQSGTSMSAPVASGAAAIVKAMNPTFSALQIGEQLRVTCDNIYSVPSNSLYIDRLGKGRINLFRSLTETGPSVRMQNLVITDNNDNTFVIGDTLNITGDIINFLAATTNLDVTVTTTSPWVTMIDNNTFVGALGTLASVDNNTDPFRFRINAGTPLNTKIRFRINFADAPYADFQLFDVTVNVDYINITINEVFTTITSKGRLCYNGEAQTEGLGFQYNGANLAYETGLMIGSSSTKVSDNVRATGANADNDFQSSLVVQRIIPTVASEFDLYGKFNDNPSNAPLPVQVTHKAYAWSTPGNTKFVIVEYSIKNSGASTQTNVHAGIFSDWDIQDYSQNKGDENAALKMGYVYNTLTGGLYAGIKLLTPTPFKHYAIDNLAGQGGVNMTDGYDTAEKFTTLSTNRQQSGVNGGGNDVIDVVSTGPFTIPAGDSIVVAFALIAGDDLVDLNTSATNAQIKYDNLLSSVNSSYDALTQLQLYPNPAGNAVHLYTGIHAIEGAEIYDITGRLVLSDEPHTLPGETAVLSLDGLANGVYSIKVSTSGGVAVLKFIKN
jgi:serine protease